MVKLRINYKSIFTHFVLMVAIFFIDEPVLFVPILVFVLLHFLMNKNYNAFLIGGVYATCMGSELVYYSYSLLILVLVVVSGTKYNLRSFLKIRKHFFILVLYLIVMYFIQLFYNHSVLSLPLFIVTFLSPICILFYIGKIPPEKISLSYIFNHVLYIAIVQVFIAFFLQAVPAGISQILSRPTIGDRVQGTTGSAPHLSVLLAASILPFLTNIRKKENTIIDKFKIIGIAGLFIALMYLNDSKTILYALILAFVFTYSINKLLLNKNAFTKVAFSLLFALITLLLFFSVNLVITKLDASYGDYIYGKYDAKVVYYKDAFSTDTRNSWEYIFGTGPGTNGSRAANALAYDVMYKKDNTVTLPTFIPSASSDFTRRYLSGLFTADYAEASKYRSALLGNPFNSVCALFVEFGIVGSALLIIFFVVLIRQNLKYGNGFLSQASFLLILAILVIAILDQALESPIDMQMMYMMVGLSMRKKEGFS